MLWFGSEQSCLAHLIQNSISEERYKTLLDEQKNAIVHGVLGYLLHIYDYNGMCKTIRKDVKISPEEARNLRQKLVANFQSGLALKQALLLALQKSKDVNNFRPKKVFQQCGLYNQEYKMFHALDSMGLKQKALKQLKTVENPIQTPDEVRQKCADTLKTLNPFIENLAWRKLRFISNTNQMTSKNAKPRDMENDLKEKAAETYYRVTPFKTELFTLNTIIRAVNNHSCKMIDRSQTAKRARGYKDGENGYFNIIRTIGTSNLSPILSDYEGSSAERDDLVFEGMDKSALTPEADLIDIAISLEKYVKQGFGNKVGRRQLVNLLTLQPDDAFLIFARKQTRIRSAEDPNDIFDRIGKDAYFDLISSFTWAPRPTIDRVANEIKNIISPA